MSQGLVQNLVRHFHQWSRWRDRYCLNAVVTFLSRTASVNRGYAWNRQKSTCIYQYTLLHFCVAQAKALAHFCTHYSDWHSLFLEELSVPVGIRSKYFPSVICYCLPYVKILWSQYDYLPIFTLIGYIL